MKKSLILGLIVALLGAALPAFAQDTSATLPDTLATQDQLTTFAAALTNADPALTTTLSDPAASFTLFAPTNEAFAALAEELGQETVDALLADPVQLSNLLSYHVATVARPSADLSAALAQSPLLTLPTLQGQYLNVLLQEGGAILVDDSQLTAPEGIAAANGVIYPVDRVLLPETATIAQIVSEASSAEVPEFASLLGFVLSADPSVAEALFKEDGEFTIFAPNDAAFAKLDQATLDNMLTDPTAVTPLLKYHILEGRWGSKELLDLITATNGQPLTLPTLDGRNITIRAEGSALFVNEVPVLLQDLDASNGLIHIIDSVLLPPAQ